MGSNANAREAKPIRALGIEWRIVPFQFTPSSSDTTAAPTINFGQITAVSGGTSSTGNYTVTVTGGGGPRMMVFPTLDMALKGLFQIESCNVNATVGSFTIRCYAFSTSNLANFTATTSTQKVSGQIWIQCSSYTR